MAADPIADALARLVTALQGGLQVTERSGVASDIYVPFQNSVTGTTAFTCWTPSAGRRYVLRGFHMVAIVREVLVTPGTIGAHALFFQDGTGATPVCPIGVYPNDAPQDTVIRSGDAPPVDLGTGIRGSVIDSPLKIATGNDIGAGSIRFTGVVWGTEVPG